ncbi:MAG: GTPase HflX, partial [Pseudomonadota bacterium]
MELTEGSTTRAWVLHPDIPSDDARREPEHALAEAVSLAHALPGLDVGGSDVVRLARPHPGKLFGKGKIEELRHLVKSEDLGLILIDGPVTPVQQRNLEKELHCKLLDRTGL